MQAEEVQGNSGGLNSSSNSNSSSSNSSTLTWPVVSDGFPLEALPQAVKRFVVELSGAFGCEPSNVAVLTLSAIAGAIGGTRRVAIRPPLVVEPCLLWSLVVCVDDGFDEMDVGRLLKPIMAPLERAQSVLLAEHTDLMRLHTRNLKNWSRTRGRLERAEAEGRQLTEWEEDSLEDPIPAPPVLRRLIHDDYRLISVMRALTGTERGILLARHGLDAWMNNLNNCAMRCDDPEWDWWRAMHDGAALSITPAGAGAGAGAGSSDAIHLPLQTPYATLNIAGGVSRERLFEQNDYPSKRDPIDLLLLTVGRRAESPPDVKLSDESQAMHAHILTELSEKTWMPSPNSQGPHGPLDWPLDAQAKVVWEQQLKRFRESRENAAAAAAEHRAVLRDAPRLALIHQFARFAALEATVQPSGVAIDEPAIRSGIELAIWFAQQRSRLRCQRDQRSKETRSQELIRHIAHAGGTVSLRDLMRHGPRFASARIAREALQELVDSNRGTFVNMDEKTGKVVFRLHEPAGAER